MSCHWCIQLNEVSIIRNASCYSGTSVPEQERKKNINEERRQGKRVEKSEGKKRGKKYEIKKNKMKDRKKEKEEVVKNRGNERKAERISFIKVGNMWSGGRKKAKNERKREEVKKKTKQ